MKPLEIQQEIRVANQEANARLEQRQQQEAGFHRAIKLEAMRIPAVAAIYYMENCRLAGYTGQIPITETEIMEDP